MLPETVERLADTPEHSWHQGKPTGDLQRAREADRIRVGDRMAVVNSGDDARRPSS